MSTMAAQTILLAATIAALAVSFTFAAPKRIRSVDLKEVINKTVCPIHIEVDDDQDRVPRRIKMMKCKQEPNHLCHSHHIPPHECCQHHHESHQLECVEMHDTVLVYYKSTKKTIAYKVSVGCTCMIVKISTATNVPMGPT